MNISRKKRGTFAARAHSFKENFLDALKSSQHSSSTPNKRVRAGQKNFIQLAKKTGSTDNLTGHLGTTRSTDCLVKEVQFALKYFQDVVSKCTYEMLPGCATVVLETVLAIQVNSFRLFLLLLLLFANCSFGFLLARLVGISKIGSFSRSSLLRLSIIAYCQVESIFVRL